MDYQGPGADDFAEVTALNRAFLQCLRSAGRHGTRLRQVMPEDLRQAVTALRDLHVERLAATPFLLLSLREGDDAFWRSMADDGDHPDLFADERHANGGLVAAALSFLWHLAQHNPYAARVLAGAGADWCSLVASRTLVQLLRHAATHPDLMQPRLAANADFWRKLLGPGLSSQADVRNAAHTACLQTLLTAMANAVPRTLRAAACRSPVPRATTARRTRRR